MAADSSPMDVVLEDLNMLLSTLDLGLNGSFDGEQGGFTRQGVQSGGRQEDAFAKSCGVVLDQVRTLERALMVQGTQQESEWDAERIVDIAVAHGMMRPAPAHCGGGSDSNGMAER